MWCAVANLEFGLLLSLRRRRTKRFQKFQLVMWNFLKPKFQNLGENATIWFQQNGTTSLTAEVSIDVLRGLFLAHSISLHGDIELLARSFDLSPCEYFL